MMDLAVEFQPQNLEEQHGATLTKCCEEIRRSSKPFSPNVFFSGGLPKSWPSTTIAIPAGKRPRFCPRPSPGGSGWWRWWGSVTHDPEPSPERWKEVTNKPANQPTKQPHLDLTSHLPLPNLIPVTPPPPPPPPPPTTTTTTPSPPHFSTFNVRSTDDTTISPYPLEKRLQPCARPRWPSVRGTNRARHRSESLQPSAKKLLESMTVLTFLALLAFQVPVFWLWNQLLSKSGSSNGSSLQDFEWLSKNPQRNATQSYYALTAETRIDQPIEDLWKHPIICHLSFPPRLLVWKLATLTGLQTDLMDVQMIRFYQLCYAPHARQQCEVHIHGHNLLQSNLPSCSMSMAERCGKLWDTWKTLHVVLRTNEGEEGGWW